MSEIADFVDEIKSIRSRLHDQSSTLQSMLGTLQVIDQKVTTIQSEAHDHESRLRVIETSVLQHTSSPGHAGTFEDMNGLGTRVSALETTVRTQGAGLAGWRAVLAFVGGFALFASPWAMFLITGR